VVRFFFAVTGLSGLRESGLQCGCGGVSLPGKGCSDKFPIGQDLNGSKDD
jgi:hypothetical protein